MRRRLVAIIMCTFFATSPAWSITNKEVLNQMDSDVASVYISATVEGIALMAYLLDNERVFQCVLNWYFHDERTVKKITATMSKYPDRTPQIVIFSLSKKACGDPRGSRK